MEAKVQRILMGVALVAWLATLAAGARGEGFEAAPGLAVQHWLVGARVGKPEVHKALAVFPVEVNVTAEVPSHRLLAQALEDGSLVVGEVSESGSVNELLVENRGKVPVFIMAGEILSGAKQDRVLQSDLWLPAQSGKVRVAAFCVERGRWSYRDGPTFQSSSGVSNAQVRAAARAGGPEAQSKVWEGVARTQSAVGYSDSTNLGETYKAPEVRQSLESFLGALGGFAQRHPRAQGVVVAVGDRFLALDLFGSRTDFEGLWPRLLPSYALEALPQGSQHPRTSPEEALRFLRSVTSARFTTESTPGEGTLVSFKGDKVVGSALLWGRAVVHLEAFPPPAAGPTPQPTNPPPIYRQYRQ